jgi:DNA-binding CsgD family transcriptional regulator
MSRASRTDGHELADGVPVAWRRLMRSGVPVAASASVRAGGVEMPVGIVAEVEFLDDQHVDVHLALAEQEDVAAVGPGALLTERERAVVALIAQGLETGEIAAELYVSAATVKTHVRNAMEKLGTHTRAQLVAVVLGGYDAGAESRSGDPPGEKSPKRAIDHGFSDDDQ